MELERFYDQSVGTWDVTKPHTVEAMRAHIEVNVLQRLRSIASLDDYKTYENGKSKIFSGAFERLKFPNMMLAAAHGDFDAALQMWPVEYWFDQRLVKFFPEFHTALEAGDHVYIAKTLHRLEAAAVTAFGMEHIWESYAVPAGAMNAANLCGELPYQFNSIWILRGGGGMSQPWFSGFPLLF